jgi:AbrB family looped-hinge helix DNA binding protein
MANVTYLTLDKKGRATLPEEVREALGVGPGDFVLLERTAGGGFELIAAELVAKDQRWFYHPEMQDRVRSAEGEFLSGESRRESAAQLERRVMGPAREPSPDRASSRPSPGRNPRGPLT